VDYKTLMRSPLFHVDVFTDRPFAGNPAGVCLLSEDREDAWMQNIAREMNLSETAFLQRREGHWDLRWFTPAVEVDLCGHATLASAHVLWEAGHAKSGEPLVFQTRSGRLAAAQRDGAIELDFPAEPAAPASEPSDLRPALGISGGRFVGRNRFDYLIEAEDERAVRALAPDFRRLAAAGGPARGVIVTAMSSQPAWDFVSRYFAPAVGIDEDPVTGSAHCCLGPFWADRLRKKALTGYQASARGGTVRVRVEEPRVFLGGTAVTISRGELA
jgi:PhzF family phenazine biosynthesis protein